MAGNIPSSLPTTIYRLLPYLIYCIISKNLKKRAKLPFVLKEYPSQIGDRIQLHLIKNHGLSPSNAQNLLDRGKIFDADMNKLKKSDTIQTDSIFISEFAGSTRGLKPIFTTDDFAIFDKPSGVIVHPVHKFTQYCLLDEVKYHFGSNANIVHRIDAETSGLVLVARTKEAEIELKTMFENKGYKKEYLAVVNGIINEQIEIDKPIDDHKESKLRVKMGVFESGKDSLTIITPLKKDFIQNRTLVKAVPITGRQHQIRVHLDHIGHTIIGDPIYGIDEEIGDAYLCKTLSDEDRIKYTLSHRLWLHAEYLEFSYKDIIYKFHSKNTELLEFFNKN
jgi:23S rRNA pseudouridine1911/1915/1917 synthase